MSRPSLLAGLAVFFVTLVTASPPGHASGERGRLLEELRTDLRDAGLAVDEERYELAADLYLAIAERARTLSHSNLPLARAIDGLADVRRFDGNLEDAAALYLESSAMWPRLLGENQPRLATTLHNLGAVYYMLGRTSDAAAPLRRALTIYEASFGPDSPQATNTRNLYNRCTPTSPPTPQPE